MEHNLLYETVSDMRLDVGSKFEKSENPSARLEARATLFKLLQNYSGFKSQQLQQWNLSPSWYSLQYCNIRGCIIRGCFPLVIILMAWQGVDKHNQSLRQKLVTSLPWFSISKENRTQNLQNVFIRELESTTHYAWHFILTILLKKKVEHWIWTGISLTLRVR